MNGAVVIGVNKTGDLPVLKGASKGARDFGTWAQNQGFEVTYLTDVENNKVNIADIFNAIKYFIEKNSCSKLMIYFSGHGILLSPNSEYWLLSDAPDNSNEAVNIAGSIARARNCGIPHVIIVSDACRSSAANIKFNQITGSVVFPGMKPGKDTEVDMFYASLPGDPAIEIPIVESINEYKGVFTECILNGLNGNDPTVIEKYNDNNKEKYIIPSRNLKSYLLREVPIEKSKIALRYDRPCQIIVESGPPKFFGELPSIPIMKKGKSLKAPKKRKLRGDSSSDNFTVGREINIINEAKDIKEKELIINYPLNEQASFLDREKTEFGKSMNRILRLKGKESFETKTGFTVFGINVKEIFIRGTKTKLFRDGDSWNIRVQNDNVFFPISAVEKSILIKFEDNTGIILAVLPGYVGTVIVEDGNVISVNYSPSRNTDKYYNYEPVSEEINRRRAFAAVASKKGVFNLKPEEGSIYGDFLRMNKNFDPTLGLYASYAYSQAGRNKDIESVYEYMLADNNPLLYDVALLAGRIKNDLLPNNIAPFLPMLTQGWALLEVFDVSLSPPLTEARKYLIPGLWTTFSEKGINILFDAIKNRLLL